MINFIFYLQVVLISTYLIASVSALVFNRKLKKQGFTGIPTKECWNPLKHLSFLLGWIIGLIPKHVMIQYAIRFLSRHCQICQSTGVCINERTGEKACGCNPYKMACSPFEKCRNHYYGPIIFNKKKAEEFLDSIKPIVKFKGEY